MKNKYLLLVSEDEKEYIDSLKYSFNIKNVKRINEDITENEINKLAEKINKNYTKIIFFNYSYKFYLLLPIIDKKIKVSWIFRYPISLFSNSDIYSYFFQIIEYKNRKLIDEVYVLDYNLYKVFKDKYKFKHLLLDIEPKNNKVSKKKTNKVGIIGMDYDQTSNFYNSLSACTFFDFDQIKVQNTMNSTIDFGKNFNLNIQKKDNLKDLIIKNDVNLYCSFSDIKIPIVLKSLDLGIPCIVGNTDIFDSNNYLKEQLVLKSDDDINEIVQKIKLVQENKKQILKEYEKYRKDYVKKSINTINRLIR